MPEEELNRAWILRKVLSALSPVEAMELLLERLEQDEDATRNSWRACRAAASAAVATGSAAVSPRSC